MRVDAGQSAPREIVPTSVSGRCNRRVGRAVVAQRVGAAGAFPVLSTVAISRNVSPGAGLLTVTPRVNALPSQGRPGEEPRPHGTLNTTEPEQLFVVSDSPATASTHAP